MKKTAAIALLNMLVLAGCESGGGAEFGRRQALASEPAVVGSAPQEGPSLPVLDESAGLPDYLAYAALNNPGLEAAFDRWKAALERIPQVTALPDPHFTYSYYIVEVETRAGPQRQSFAVSQLFPWFGKLKLRGDIAAQRAESAQREYEAAKLALFFEVKDAWYEYYYLAKAISITKDNMALLEHVESVARSRYKAAAASHPDVVRAQVELGKLEDRYKALLDLKEPLAARLNAALNRPMEAPIPWPDEIVVPPVHLVQAELLDALIESNPQLQAMDFEIAARLRDIDLAKKDYYPDFQLGVGVIDTGPALMPNTPDSGKDPVIASVQVNVPISREKYEAEVREARLRHQAARRQRTEKANTLSAELKMSLYGFRDAERKINLYGETLLPKAEESLNVTESSYRTGSGSFTDLVDAQRILLEFQLDYQRALANRAQSLAKLEMLVGKNIDSAGNSQASHNVRDNSVAGVSEPGDVR